MLPKLLSLDFELYIDNSRVWDRLTEIRHLWVDPQQIESRFSLSWLPDKSENVTVLHLRFSKAYGYCPKLEFSHVRLRQLREVSFGNFAFCHVWQWLWLCSHNSNLQPIMLHACPILKERITTTPLDDDGDPIEFTTYGDAPCQVVKYDRTWGDIFERLSDFIGGLRRFRFTNDPIYTPVSTVSTSQSRHTLHKHRYTMYYKGFTVFDYKRSVTKSDVRGLQTIINKIGNANCIISAQQNLEA